MESTRIVSPSVDSLYRKSICARLRKYSVPGLCSSIRWLSRVPKEAVLSWSTVTDIHTICRDSVARWSNAEQLVHLHKAKTWYIDGTFKLVRHPFTQLLTINAFVRKEQDTKPVSLVFVLMSGKKKKDYRTVRWYSVIKISNDGMWGYLQLLHSKTAS